MTGEIKPNIKRYVLYMILLTVLYGVITLLLSTGVLNNYYRGILLTICINIILAVSLNLSTGFLGQLVLGHAAFMYVGAYAAAIFSIKMGFSSPVMIVPSLLFGGCVAALFGVIIGVPALRLTGDYLAIITLAFGQIIKSLITNMEITGGPKGLMRIPELTNFTVAFLTMLVCVALMYNLVNSRHGRAMISIREDETAAEACGISTTYYKVFGFSIAAFFAGIAGGLQGHYLTMLMPKNIGYEYSIELLVIVVLGGMGSITGSVIAAIVLTILPELLRDFAAYRMLIYSTLLVVMMIYRPKGLMGTTEFSFDKLSERLTAKKRRV